jgi:hypothetical protein
MPGTPAGILAIPSEHVNLRPSARGGTRALFRHILQDPLQEGCFRQQKPGPSLGRLHANTRAPSTHSSVILPFDARGLVSVTYWACGPGCGSNLGLSVM